MDRTEAKILTKKCTKCGETKPTGEGGDFAKSGKKADGSPNWRSECKTCTNNYNDKKRSCPEYREWERQQKAKWYVENKEALLQACAKYNSENPQATGLTSAVRRSTLSDDKLFDGATREFVRAETKFDYILRRLISEKTGIAHDVDHIIPLDKSGTHRLENLRVIPSSLNRSKQNKFDEEWFGITDEDEEERTRETLEFSASLKKTLIHA